MNASSYFLLSFTGPLVGGGLTAYVAWLAKDWLNEHHLPAMVMMFLGFIITFVLARWAIHSMVPVCCPKCSKHAAYEMDGISSRFRCRVCGKEF